MNERRLAALDKCVPGTQARGWNLRYIEIMRVHPSSAGETIHRPDRRARDIRNVSQAAGRILALLCLLSLWAPAWAAPVPKTTVLMIQWRGETPAEKGFKDELRKAAAGVAFVTFDADQDKDRLLEYLRGEFTGKAHRFDYVYSFGTTASERVRRVLSTVDAKGTVHIMNIIADPVAARLANSLAAAGENRIVGCHMIPLETQLRNAMNIVPFRKLGLIFNPREENSNIQLQQATGLSDKLGFTVVPIRIRPEREDLETALRQIEDKKIDVDCVYLPSESFLVSRAKEVVQRLNAAKVPTIAAVEPYMQEGALTGTIASYDRLGRLVARVVAKDLKSRPARNNWPVILDPSPEFLFNTATASALGIKPEEPGIAGLKYIK